MQSKRFLGLVLSLLLLVAGPRVADAYRSQSATPLPIQADLDGDRRTDHLTGDPQGSTGYVGLRAVMGDGRTLLLPVTAAGLPGVRSALVADLGGPRPAIVITKETGGSIGSLVEAFTYDSRARNFRRLPWDGHPLEGASLGLTPSYNPTARTIIIPVTLHDPVRHTLLKLYRYRGGQLQLAEVAYGPAAEDLPYPAEEWAILVAALNTVGLRLPLEAPRYFASVRSAEALYRHWTERIPEGMTFYLDQSYLESGIDRTFVLWGNPVSPSGKQLDRAVGLQGTVSFTLRGDRKVIGAIGVQEVPLLVATPQQALNIVRGLPEAQGVRDLPPPAFLDGRWQVCVAHGDEALVVFVDSRTGQIERVRTD